MAELYVHQCSPLFRLTLYNQSAEAIHSIWRRFDMFGRGIRPFDPDESYLDEVIGYPLAILGFYFQAWLTGRISRYGGGPSASSMKKRYFPCQYVIPFLD